MPEAPKDSFAQVRRLECWLPFAQEANLLYGWGYDGPGLERLVMTAAADLESISHPFQVHVILWHHHHRAMQQIIGPGSDPG